MNSTSRQWYLRSLVVTAVLSFCLLCVVAVQADTVGLSVDNSLVELEQTPDYYQPLIGYVEWFIDDSLELSVEDVFAHDLPFQPVTTPYLDFGLSNGRVWLRMSVHNPSESDGIWRLDLRRQYNKEISVFIKRDNLPIERVLYDTDQMSFKQRKVPTILLGTDIQFAAREQAALFVAYRSTSTTYLPLGIGTVEATVKLHGKEHTINWIMNGALLAMTVFALLMTALIGWRLSVSFSLYIIAGLFYVLNADGYTYRYFWPDTPELNDPMNLALMLVMSAFGLNFSRQLFQFKNHKPIFDKALIGMIYTAGFFALLAIPFIDNDTLMIVGYSLVPIGSLTQVLAGVIALRLKLLGSLPYFIGAAIVLSSMIYAAVAHVVPGYYNLDTTLDYGHFALLTECLAFAGAITIRLLGVREQRDRALKAELQAIQDRLRISSELQKSQQRYLQARKMSDMHKVQLSAVSHDLQQPLASLRVALRELGGADEDARQKMHTAFDYLESLADQNLPGDKRQEPSELQAASSASERFPISIVLDNVYQMFKAEASAKLLDLRYHPLDTVVECEPVALMRAINNLVANAINNTDGGGVLLAARRRNGRLRVEVWDTGVGMTQKSIALLMQPYQKGESSDGSGLGLSIVSDLSTQLSLDFKLHSRLDRGTAAFLYLAIAD